MIGKAEFTTGMAEKFNLTKKQAQEELNHVLTHLQDTLQEGNDVNLTGYIKFRLKEVEERVGRNPQSGEAVTVPAHRQVRASIGSKLKQAVK